MDNISGMAYMVDTRGSVHDVRSWEIDNMKQIGWRIILSPKKRYYAEFDIENNEHIGSTAEDDPDDFYLKGVML